MRVARVRVGVLAAVVALLGTLSVGAVDSAFAAVPTTLSGTIHLSDGGAMTGEVTVALGERWELYTHAGPVVVGADGSYSLDISAVPTGDYALYVTVQGMPYRLPNPYEAPQVHVDQGQSVSGIDVTLMRFEGLSGKVTVPASAGDPSPGGRVELVGTDDRFRMVRARATFGSDGVFVINTRDVLRGQYTLRATVDGAVSTYLGDVPSMANAERILVVPDAGESGLDITLGDSVHLEGTFSNPDGAYVSLGVFADDGERYAPVQVHNGASVDYHLDVPVGVEVFIQASVDGQVPLFVGGGTNPDNAHRFTWASPGTQSLPTFTVNSAGAGHAVTGTVSIAGSAATGTDLHARIVTTDGRYGFAEQVIQNTGSAFYAAPQVGDGSQEDIAYAGGMHRFGAYFIDGQLSIHGVPDGTYTLFLSADSAAGSFGSSYLGGSQFAESATTFTVSGGDVDLGAVTLGELTSGVRGVVTGDGTAFARDYTSIFVLAQNPATSKWEDVALPYHGGVHGSLVSGVSYQFDLPPGTYRIAAWDEGPNGAYTGYRGEFFDGAALLANSTPVTVTAGTYTEGIDFDLSRLGPVSSTRFAGSDRYATAVEVSKTFSPGVSVVYVASGENFPDALAAAPAAALAGGPLLTVRHDGVPDVVAAELTRLAPAKIVVVGGTAAVNAAVYAQLATYAGVGGISRLSGADRYATARAIVNDAFGGTGPGSSVVWVASGKGFPDALSAAGAAGAVGAPVITIDGQAASLDPGVVQLIQDLGADTVLIAGGTAVISPALEAQLAGVAGVTTVTRRAGSDRYSTGAAINYYGFSHPTTAFIANGTNFPDALAGAALAGQNHAPLYIVPGGCVPGFVVDDLNRMGVSQVNILGGTAAVSVDIHHVTTC